MREYFIVHAPNGRTLTSLIKTNDVIEPSLYDTKQRIGSILNIYSCIITIMYKNNEKMTVCIKDTDLKKGSEYHVFFSTYSPLSAFNILKKLQIENESEECVICLDNKPNCIFAPCYHNVVCSNCEKQTHCPICREEIYSRQYFGR